MKKLYIPLLAAAALSFSACNSDDSGIFDSSAAERLEQSRNEYKDLLTADGGLWSLEYFTNDEEPGYVMVMQFGNNGAVEVSADHKWIGNKFQQETSLWDVISDNGTVLTFNTYNTLFHVFSTPENIEGSDAPKNEYGEDINELGYGHEGDYEFLLMSHDSEGNLRLVGKKHGKEAWLRKLDASVDPEEYLNAIKARRAIFSSKFPEFVMTEHSGATYTVNNLGSGIPSIFPRDFNGVEADPVTQTVSAHGVLTAKGFRFRTPLEVKRADDTTFEIQELLWQEDGSLSCSAATITAPMASSNLSNARLIWKLDKDSMTDVIKAAHDAASDALVASTGKNFDLREVTYGYNALNGKPTMSITIKVGSRLCRDFCDFTISEDGKEVTLALIEANKASAEFDEKVPEYKAFKQMISGTFIVNNADAMNPTTIHMVSKSNPALSFSVDVQ